jgi:hypothetical protein
LKERCKAFKNIYILAPMDHKVKVKSVIGAFDNKKAKILTKTFFWH